MIDLQFLKVRDWSIKFRYKGQIYIIKDCSDDESIIGLFKFHCDKCGRYKVEYLCSSYFGGFFPDAFVGIERVYAHIDKVAFLHKIIDFGFGDYIHIDYCDLYR